MTARMAFNESAAAAAAERGPAVQVGALCIDPDSGKVLLVTSRGTGRWIIPKGWPMRDKTLSEAALVEAWEEGGVKGPVSAKEIGEYAYDKLREDGSAIPVVVRVFAVRAKEVAKDFPEADQRRRKWVSAGKAAGMVDEKGLKKLLRGLAKAH